MNTILATVALLAQVFTYQGVLKNDSGGRLDVDTLTFEFRLYGAIDDDRALWGRRYSAVPIDTNGVFRVEVTDPVTDDEKLPESKDAGAKYEKLGEALLASDRGFLYVGVTLDGADLETRPRTRIMPLPYASSAEDALAASGPLRVEGKATAVKLNVNSSLEVTSNLEIERLEGGSIRSVGSISAASLAVDGDAAFDQGLSVGGSVSAGSLKSGAVGVSYIKTGKLETEKISADRAVIDAITGDVIAEIPKVGSIIMWYGDIDNIPENWALCDGKDGRPNLIHRFPVGVDTRSGYTQYALGDTGGAEAVTLEINNLPAHTHKYTVSQNARVFNTLYGSSKDAYTLRDYDLSGADYTNLTGGGKAHDNLPPYMNLVYLIKVK